MAPGAGFAIDEVVADNGVSGVHTRLAERSEGRRLYDKLRKGDVLMGRCYSGVLPLTGTTAGHPGHPVPLAPPPR